MIRVCSIFSFSFLSTLPCLCNDSIVPSTVDTSVICISGVLAMMPCEAHVTIFFGHIAAQNKVKPHSLYVTTQNLCMVSEVKAKTTKQLL